MLIALERLVDDGTGAQEIIDQRPCARNVRLIARTMQYLCQQVTAKSTASPSSALEASRQVINWLAGLCTSDMSHNMPLMFKYTVGPDMKLLSNSGMARANKHEYQILVTTEFSPETTIPLAMTLDHDAVESAG